MHRANPDFIVKHGLGSNHCRSGLPVHVDYQKQNHGQKSGLGGELSKAHLQRTCNDRAGGKYILDPAGSDG
jgi:hypothetical protein